MSEPTVAPIIQILTSIDTRLESINNALRLVIPNEETPPEERTLAEILAQGVLSPNFWQEGGLQPLAQASFTTLQATRQSVIDLQPFLTAITTANNITASNVLLVEAWAALTYNVIAAQLSPGTITLSVAEQLNAIRENTGGDDPGALLDALNTLANQQRTLVSIDGGLQTYTTAQLLYALGLCSCEDFPPSVDPNPEPTNRPACLDGVNAGPYEFQATALVSQGVVTIDSNSYSLYSYAFTYPGPLASQDKSYTAIPGGGGVPFLPLRDGGVPWTSQADRLGVTIPNPSAQTVLFGWASWPYAQDALGSTDAQSVATNWSSGQRVSSAGVELCTNIGSIGEIAETDPDEPSNWRAILLAVPVGYAGDVTESFPIIRVLASSGLD